MVRTNKNIFVHSPVVGHLGYFQLLTTTNNVAINIFAHVTWFTCAYISKEYETRSRNAGLHGVYIVNFIRSLLPNFFLNWLYHFSILSAVYMNVFYCNTHLMCLFRFLWPSPFLSFSFWTSEPHLVPGPLPDLDEIYTMEICQRTLGNNLEVQGSNFLWHKPWLMETRKGRKPGASFLSSQV